MNDLISIKSKNSDCEIVYEARCIRSDEELLTCFSEQEIQNNLQRIELELSNNQKQLNSLNKDIDDLTNHADYYDYLVAAASGFIAGLIDSFFVGKWSLAGIQEWGTNTVNDFVIKVASLKNPKVHDLTSAIAELEKNELGSDKLRDAFGGASSHHLFDFTHHCSPSGLFFSLFAQFHPDHLVCGTDVSGNFITVPLEGDALNLVGSTFSEKIHFGVYNWLFHMASDVAGSQGSARVGRAGSGLPGPIMSMVKELSSSPLFGPRNSETRKELSLKISRLFRGMEIKDFNGTPIKFDVRTGVGATLTLAKMSLTVLINELVVRTFYFLRRLIKQIKDKSIISIRDLNRIEWNKTNPFSGRTITRMMTVASGTFVLVDLVDAAIRSAIESGGNPYAFLVGILFRINIVGIGRFIFAIGEELFKEVQKNQLIKERIILMNERIQLLDTKVYYRIQDTWIVMEDTEKCINELSTLIIQTAKLLEETNRLNNEDLKKIEQHIDEIKESNPELIKELKDVWDE